MASIRRRGGKWQAQIRRRGTRPVSKTFTRKADALTWARQVETEVERGIFIDPTRAEHKATKLKSELVENGLDATKVKAIRAPAGLDIAATTPEEIAVSILAEMIQLRHAQMLPATDARAETDDAIVSVEIVAQSDCGVEGSG